jgi:hypothetical protein
VIGLLREEAEVLRPMAARDEAGYGSILHRMLELLARKLTASRRRAEATAALVEALELIARLAAADAARYGRRHAGTLRELAALRAGDGDALALQDRALAILRASDSSDAGGDLAQALVERAGLHEDSGDATAALRDLREGVEAFRGLFLEEPRAHAGRFASALTHLAISLWGSGERTSPPALLREAVAADRESRQHRHISRSRRLNARADVRSVRAEAEIWRVLCAAEPEAHRPDLCSALLRLAALEGRPAGAEARQLLRIFHGPPQLRPALTAIAERNAPGGPVPAEPDENTARLISLIQTQQETIDYLVQYIERVEQQLNARIDALEPERPAPDGG